MEKLTMDNFQIKNGIIDNIFILNCPLKNCPLSIQKFTFHGLLRGVLLSNCRYTLTKAK